MGNRTRQSKAHLAGQIEAPSSGLVQRLFWRLFSVGALCVEGPEGYRPAAEAGAHLFWVVSGQGTLDTQGVRYQLKPGRRVWFVDLTQPQLYTPRAGTRLTLRGIRFGGECLKNWHDQLGGSQRVEFNLNDTGTIRRSYRELEQILKRRPADHEWKAHLLLDRTLGELLASRGALPTSDAEPPLPVSLVVNAVSDNPARNWKAKDLVRVSRVSYSGLRRLFSKARQETLHDFIQRVRVEQAKGLLADPRLSVKQVSATLQFTNEMYFSRFFKRAEGRSPSEFRAALNGGQTPPTQPLLRPAKPLVREVTANRRAGGQPIANGVLV